jgi:hypothetical protein
MSMTSRTHAEVAHSLDQKGQLERYSGWPNRIAQLSNRVEQQKRRFAGVFNQKLFGSFVSVPIMVVPRWREVRAESFRTLNVVDDQSGTLTLAGSFCLRRMVGRFTYRPPVFETKLGGKRPIQQRQNGKFAR